MSLILVNESSAIQKSSAIQCARSQGRSSIVLMLNFDQHKMQSIWRMCTDHIPWWKIPEPDFFCGNQWTESRFDSFIKSLLRSGTVRWGPIQQCLKDARIRRGYYKCECCGKEVTATKVVTLKNGKEKRVKNIVVDHINPIVPVTGWVSWDDCIENMFCEADGLSAICYDCHSIKSAEEAAERAKYRRLAKEKLQDK